MARPIEDTPILTGKDAERFIDRLLTSDERKASKEEIEHLREVYKAFKAMMVD